jgi:tRNA G10  N-methylase Trm11
MLKYLVTFAQIKEEFRLPELVALCKYFDLKLDYEPGAYRNDVLYARVVFVP